MAYTYTLTRIVLQIPIKQTNFVVRSLLFHTKNIGLHSTTIRGGCMWNAFKSVHYVLFSIQTTAEGEDEHVRKYMTRIRELY